MTLTQKGLWLGWSKPLGNVRSVSIEVTLLQSEAASTLSEAIAIF